MGRMKVNPGELDKRIQIFREEDQGEDEEGYPLERKEVAVRDCWAKFGRTSGTSALAGGTELSEVKCRFLVRHSMSKPLDEDMKIRYAGEVYRILYINDYEDNHQYDEIWCDRRA